jgi:hypothetical protein
MEGTQAMNIAWLMSDAARLAEALDDLGFNADESISGADTVDVIARYMPLLRALPALAQLAAHADLLIRHGGGHNHTALAQALSDLKEN